MRTNLLEQLYHKYDIYNLKFGKIHDKLGDVFEEFCVIILNQPQFLDDIKRNPHPISLEHDIFIRLLTVNGIHDFNNISSIQATNIVPHRPSGGNAKTDVIITVNWRNGDIAYLPISCKQSTAPKVAIAEFDVDTICRELNINNSELHYLLMKHQTDASAKNFTAHEKKRLVELIKPIAREFVRWALTGSPEISVDNICAPISMIKFDLTKPSDRYDIRVDKGDFDLKSFNTYTIEEYIDKIMLTAKGKVRTGGFGTGLSWTYATGSKGLKIQFKG